MSTEKGHKIPSKKKIISRLTIEIKENKNQIEQKIIRK